MSEPFRFETVGYFRDAGDTFDEGEVVCYDSSGLWIKASASGVVGIAGFAGTRLIDVSTVDEYTIWAGMLRLGNDPDPAGAVGQQHRYGTPVYLMSDGKTVTRNAAAGVASLWRAFDVRHDGRVSVSVVPPGGH